jgi:hypothetical protein
MKPAMTQPADTFRAEVHLLYTLARIAEEQHLAARTTEQFADVRALRAATQTLWADCTHRYADLPTRTFTRIKNDVAAEFGARTAAPKPTTHRRSQPWAVRS